VAKRLTPAQRKEIKAKLAAGVKISQINKQTGISIPTIYNIKKEGESTSTVADLLQQTIAKAEQEVAEIEKKIRDVERLREELKVKKAFLDSLRKTAKLEVDVAP
jgi:hypothetical protein